MYYYISGKLILARLSTAVIDAGGVGYKLTISATTLGKLSGKEGQNALLYTHLSIREDAHELFGFYTEEEKNTFQLLTSVSGIGPKAAMAILSVMTPEKLAIAVATGDAKAISKAQGVGAKSAARVVLELKDKLKADITSAEGEEDADLFSATTPGNNLADAEAALMVLGYSKQEAVYALKGLDPQKDTETLIREGLKKLMK
ncbi:MAG: Holliday junction branch migration protein RuvA [Clostridia bacterium]|nr:Holliday junction branch migration protein RuvA [Clostridia bacterium]